jgi:hypothetical protein
MQNRPHIEFVQAQMLPWRRIPPGAARPDAEYKFLSRDAGDGACSCLIRYPAGWRRDANEALRCAEELYVLDGELWFDDAVYPADTYAYIPAGFPRRVMHAQKGAVVLTFFDRQPEYVSSNDSVIKQHPQPSLVRMDVLQMPWDMRINDPNLAHLGISRKNLRADHVLGERTFLSMILPHSQPPGCRGPTETHPVVEEAYILSGSLIGPHGEMHPGAYFWRPPGIAHGPFGTRWGCVALIRFLGGRHENKWSDVDAPFAFDAPYKPVLPEELRYLSKQPFVPASVY